MIYTCKYCKKKFDNYYARGGHTGHCKLNPFLKENNKKVLEKGKIVLSKQKEKRIYDYNLKPKQCNFCFKNLDYKNRNKKFCNSSCSAKFNNVFNKGKKRNFSENGIENIRDANKKKSSCFSKIEYAEIINLFEASKVEFKGRFSTKIYNFICPVCKKIFITTNNSKKTCSNDCRTIYIFKSRSYQNGKKHYTKYFNKWINFEVTLESSWEVIVAKKLDEENIKWERPKPLKWKDKNNINRLYFPDFYLNDYDIYLDPKNPYCMQKDKEKMGIVSKEVKIEFGDIKKIIEYISTIE